MSVKVLFLGSNHEAVETLKALHEDKNFEIVGVITQPDKPVGRKRQVLETEIKRFCIEKNLEIFYTNRDEEKYRQALEIFKPELVVCKSFGEIVPKFFLEYPKHGAINIHFSLLPKYRGAVPIQMALLKGDEETGISIIKMTEELDAGDILAKFKEKVRGDDTNITLRKRLVEKTARELPEVLKKWISGETVLERQSESDATYCWKEDISKEKARIDFDNETADYIERKVRAFVPWPVAWMEINGKKAKVFEVEKRDDVFLKPKEFKTDNLVFLIGTKKDTIEVKKLQMEGKKEMDIREFLNGVDIFELG